MSGIFDPPSNEEQQGDGPRSESLFTYLDKKAKAKRKEMDEKKKQDEKKK